MIHALQAALLAVLFAVSVHGQSLLVSTRTTAMRPGHADVAPDDILVHSLTGGGTRHLVSGASLDAMVGDADGNGAHDDGPSAVDGVAVGPAGGVLGHYVTFTTTVTFADGTTARDGDIITIEPNGSATLAWTENALAAATGTSTIDVDAVHVEPDGTLLFSFDADEPTTQAALIAANGGNAVLDESSVFRLAPGDVDATLLLSRSQVLGTVNTALGTTLSSVVDTVGITDDPNHPGHYWIALGSANSALEGTVFSTFAGGTIAVDSLGDTVDSTALGFDEQEILGALAVTTTPNNPALLLDAFPTIGPGMTADFTVVGLPAHGACRLAAAHSTSLPMATPLAGLTAPGLLFVNPSDPFLYVTMSSAAFVTQADAGGRATFTFDLSRVPAGLQVTLQAFDPGSLAGSWPIAIDT